jgi:hypothetical protein
MSYSNPERIQYAMPSVTAVTAAATIATINGPKGKSGRIADIIAHVTTTHVLGSSAVTKLNVGYGSGDNLLAMASYAPPAATAGAQLSATNVADALKPTFRLPADTPVLVSTIANAGGDAAGVISYSIAIDWF